MRKIIIAIVFLLALVGCGAYAPPNQWKTMKFSTPPDRTDQGKADAVSDCIKQVDDPNGGGMSVLMGLAVYSMKMGYAYQDCMAAKGYPCKEDTYPCAYEPRKK